MEFVRLDAERAFNKALETKDSKEKIIVCGSLENTSRLEEGKEFNKISEDDIREASQKINASDWFELREKELLEELEDSEFDFEETIGEWPGEIDEAMEFTLASDILTGKLLKSVYGVKLSVSSSAEILLRFKYGGWNDCPSTEEHLAIWSYWEKKYGAKIVGVGHDIIEAYVESPPSTRDEAMNLAHQQYFYCCDIVEQGCETIANLAATLQNSRVWYFWWD